MLGAVKVRDAGDLLKIGALRLRRVAHKNMPVCYVDVHALTQLAAKGVELLGARAADAAAGKGLRVAHAVDEAAVVRDNVAAFEQCWVKVGEVIHDGGVPPAAGWDKEHAQLFHALHRADVRLGNLVAVVQEGLVHISCYQLVHASPFTCAPGRVQNTSCHVWPYVLNLAEARPPTGCEANGLVKLGTIWWALASEGASTPCPWPAAPLRAWPRRSGWRGGCPHAARP